MLNPFSEIEQMVNEATADMLANAVAVFEGGEPFGVVFDRGVVHPLGLVESAGLTAGFELRHAPGLRHDGVLVIDDVGYRVVGGLEPDSSGWVNVQLREA